MGKEAGGLALGARHVGSDDVADGVAAVDLVTARQRRRLQLLAVRVAVPRGAAVRDALARDADQRRQRQAEVVAEAVVEADVHTGVG